MTALDTDNPHRFDMAKYTQAMLESKLYGERIGWAPRRCRRCGYYRLIPHFSSRPTSTEAHITAVAAAYLLAGWDRTGCLAADPALLARADQLVAYAKDRAR